MVNWHLLIPPSFYVLLSLIIADEAHLFILKFVDVMRDLKEYCRTYLYLVLEHL